MTKALPQLRQRSQDLLALSLMVRTCCRALGPYLKEFRMGGEYDQQIREVAMYSLPKEFDEKRFIGCTLYEIGFNANQIRLSFEPNLVVVLEGEVELWLSEHEQLMISPQEPKLELLRLIESTVESVALDASRAKFELCFNGDYRLTLLVDSDYESYRIDDGATEGNYPPK